MAKCPDKRLCSLAHLEAVMGRTGWQYLTMLMSKGAGDAQGSEATQRLTELRPTNLP